MAEKPAPKKAGWKAPPRRYFGPKDENGERLEEEEYSHCEYPKCLYHPTLEPVIVNDEDEHAAMDKEWADKPYGPASHPSQAEILATKVAAAGKKK